MRIASISMADLPPIQNFQVADLSDLVVIAGPNGVGKTRLVLNLLNTFRGSPSGVTMEIEATAKDEQDVFGAKVISTADPGNLERVQQVLRANKLRRNYKSGVLYFESGRTIKQVKALPFQFDFPDPWEEQVSWDLSMGELSGRWQDTQHAIFKKIQNQKTLIANRAIELKGKGQKSMSLKFTDPLDMFREAFSKLLGPKILTRVDMGNQELMYEEEGEERSISTLSSGEREVLTVTFDFLLRRPRDCIVFFDEPELHLHPELLIRMVATLRSIGGNNQFIFLSHSPDLVSSSLDDSVIFLTPKREDGSNQAIVITPGDETTKAMHQLGHSVGVLSLGRKIVIVEGADASLDKRTYGQILENRFPALVIVPGGGKHAIESFGHLVSGILDKSIWGVEFFMLTDRDAEVGVPTGDPRLAQLPRYHLENYFLDAEVLAASFEDIEDSGSWLRNAAQVEQALSELALDKVSYAVALRAAHSFRRRAGNINIMPSGAHGMGKTDLMAAVKAKAAEERLRSSEALDEAEVEKFVSETFDAFSTLVTDGSGSWKLDVPGKPIFNAFCSKAGIQSGRLKNLYLNTVRVRGAGSFDEIIAIFDRFDKL